MKIQVIKCIITLKLYFCFQENQYNKMEKADILELTVKHLKNMMSQQKRPTSRYSTRSPDLSSHDAPMQNSNDHIQNYTAGFIHCASEVKHYMEKTATVQQDIKNHLSNHLNARLQDMPKSDRVQSPPPKVNSYVQILPKETVIVGSKNEPALSSPLSPSQGVQCVQSLPILNGQTFVLTNPIQGLHSPTYQPMIQLTQPLVTYIPQQQVINNNNVSPKTAQTVQSDPVVESSSSVVPRCKQNNDISSVHTNPNVRRRSESDGVPTAYNRQALSHVNNKNAEMATKQITSRSHTSVSNQCTPGDLLNLNVLNREDSPRDFNINKRYLSSSLMLQCDEESGHHVEMNTTDNHRMHYAPSVPGSEQYASHYNNNRMLANASRERNMWRPW